MQYIKLKRNKLKREDDYEEISRKEFCVSGHKSFVSVLACLVSIRRRHVGDGRKEASDEDKKTEDWTDRFHCPFDHGDLLLRAKPSWRNIGCTD
jgi:hypothetical protein